MNSNEGKLRTACILSGALHASQCVLVFMIFFLAHEGGWPVAFGIREGNEVFVYALGFMGFATGTMSLMFPLLQAKSGAVENKVEHVADLVELEGRGASVLFSDFGRIDEKTQTLMIVRSALAESVTIFGLVLAFLNQAPLNILPFFAAGITLTFLASPFRWMMARK